MISIAPGVGRFELHASRNELMVGSSVKEIHGSIDCLTKYSEQIISHADIKNLKSLNWINSPFADPIKLFKQLIRFHTSGKQTK